MNKTKNILWGIALVIVGVVFGLKALNIINFSLFFEGWWTLFIIVPCLIGLFTEQDKAGNIIGLIIGGGLLLGCQDMISFDILWKLLVPAIIVVIGLKMILKGVFGNNVTTTIPNIEINSDGIRSSCATFSGTDMIFDGDVFEGAELNAIFGGIKCDLRNAIIEKDCVIKVSAIFGGIDILASNNINVVSDSTCLFGGMSNKTPKRENVPTIYVTGTCMFGGVDIK